MSATATKEIVYTIASRDGASIEGTHNRFSSECRFSADLGVLMVRMAWEKGCPGLQVADWSILRDADEEQHLNHLGLAISYLENLS